MKEKLRKVILKVDLSDLIREVDMLEEFQARENKVLKQELEKSDSTHPDSQKDDPPKKDSEAFNIKSLLIKKTDTQLL